MNSLRFILLMLLAGLAQLSAAAETIGGAGIPYAARIVFHAADLNKTINLQSGDELPLGKQANANLTAASIGMVTANSWCNPSAYPTGSDCYGSSQNSQWFLLDLSKLGKRKIWAEITLEKTDDSNANQLVPAFSLWRGQQNQGLFGAWYPSKFQGFTDKGKADGGTPTFWAWNLMPLKNVSGNASWATASANTDKSKATQTQQISLKGGESNYLTLIVGSDNNQADLQNQNAGFNLSIKLNSKKPGAAQNPTPIDKYDKYGCEIGVTCKHPQMGHCMAKSLCNSPQYQGQCLLCPQ